MRHLYLNLFCLLFALTFSGLARAQEAIDIRIVYAKSMRPLQRGDTTIHRLLGEVALAHDSAVMFCDSAYVFPETNTFDAFGRVRIKNGAMRIRGDEMHYDGDTGKGRMLGQRVVLIDSAQDAKLYSDQLFFDTQTNEAWYTTWGHLYSGESDLKSSRGYYYSDTHVAVVAGNVVFHSDEVDALADSLQYNRREERCYFWKRATVFQKESTAISQEGWFDRVSGLGEFRGEVDMDRGSERLFADWIYVDREMKFIDAQGHVAMEDSLGYNRIYSQRVRYWNDPRRGIADNEPMLWTLDTTSAQTDTLYMRANQFVGWQVPRDTVGIKPDTLTFGRAEGAVRLFRNDLQLIADTVYYNGTDSTVLAWRKPYPYLWGNESQVSAKLITGYLSQQIDSLHFQDKVIVASQVDSLHFNQMSGRDMWAYFSNSEVYRIDVKGDGDVIFYMDDDGQLIGINRIKSPHFVVHVKNREPKKVVFYQNPHSNMLPIQDATVEDQKIFGFEWREDLRPIAPKDIIPSWLNDIDFYRARKKELNAAILLRPTVKNIEPKALKQGDSPAIRSLDYIRQDLAPSLENTAENGSNPQSTDL